MNDAITILRYKLRGLSARDTSDAPHVRAVVARNHVRIEPGVDLFGADAELGFSAAKPLIDWLQAMEPGVPVRAIIVDREACRVHISIDERIEVPGETSSAQAKLRPRMFRADGALAEELLQLAEPIDAALQAPIVAALARRSAPNFA